MLCGCDVCGDGNDVCACVIMICARMWLCCVCVLCRTMMIGANKDGWWDEIKLMHQSEDVLDFLEAWDTENKYQFIGHFDQSVAHKQQEKCKCIGA